jgi:type I restriction enzyme S subunit
MDDHRDLPSLWIRVPLGELVHSMRNGVYKPASDYGDDGIVTLRMYNINDGRLVLRDLKRVRLTQDELEQYGLLEGDLLVNRVNSVELVGKACVIPPNMGLLAFESKNIRIRTRNGVDPKLVNLWMRTPEARNEFRKNCKATTGMASIDQQTLAALQYPLPPINEQKRIVAKIEELTTRSQRAKEALDAVPPLLDKLRQSILAAAFRGDLTADWRAKNVVAQRANRMDRGLPETWTRMELRELITSLDQGWSPKCINEPRSSYEEWAVMKTTAVQPARFYPEENKRLPPALLPRPNAELREGDLLITRAGPRSRAGVCCRVTEVPSRLMACDKVYRFRVDESVVFGEYVELVLNSPSCLRAIEEMKTGISDSGVNLTQSKFMNLMVPVAPMAEQGEILKRLRPVLNVGQEFGARLQQFLAQFEILDRSILAKALRGDLVPQDPTDEPASVLLDRIRATREATVPPKPRRARKASAEAPAPPPKQPRPQKPTPEPAQLTLELTPSTLATEVFPALWLRGPLDKGTAVRTLAEHLRTKGLVEFTRLRADGPLYTQLLAAIEAAAKSGELDRPRRGHVRAIKLDANAYAPDDWRQVLLASLGHDPTHQEDAVRQAAEWARDNLGLEFTRIRADGHIATGLRSAITSAIRQGLVERDGPRRIRLARG